MQRRLALAAAFLLAALTFSAPAEARVNPQNAGLQVALRAWGTYLGPIDGIAGPMTARAVRVFQRRAGLRVDGVPGKSTRRAMGRLGRPLYGKRTMQRSMVGWDVAVLQFMLARRGSSPGIVDGYFGKETGRALRRFQRRHGLSADAVGGAGDAARARRRRRGERALGATQRADGQGEAQLLGRRVHHEPAVHPRARVGRVGLAEGRRLAEGGSRRHAGDAGDVVVRPGRPDRASRPRSTDGNIQIGVVYIRHLYRHYNGNVRLALAAYNQGPGSLRKRGMYRETRQYVRNVLAMRGRVSGSSPRTRRS